MYQTRKTFIHRNLKMSDLVLENPSLLLMMEHFDINIVVRNKTVAQLCSENQIGEPVFLSVVNLYNGFTPANINDQLSREDVKPLIEYLKNSHRYYLDEKIPEIQGFVRSLYAKNNSPEIGLVEKFFDEYSKEVEEHLSYEDKIAFPHFHYLAHADNNLRAAYDSKFSAGEYLKHHTDIESKLGELKNLLLKHIPLKQDGVLRRKLLTSLFELEHELTIHSVVEESILIPLIQKIEKQIKRG